MGYTIYRAVIDEGLIEEARHHVEWLLDITEEFIDPNIALFASHYICKPAGDRGGPRSGSHPLRHPRSIRACRLSPGRV